MRPPPGATECRTLLADNHGRGRAGVSGERLVWTGPGRFVPAPDVAPLAVADSWLVDDGGVLALDAHAARFRAAAAAAGADPGRIRAFWADALARVPRTGRWFPRVELTPDARAHLWLRPAPATTSAVRMLVGARGDGRTAPTVKGPDLDHLAARRAEALDRETDEALILADDGRVLEGTTTSLLWWRGETLCFPPVTGERLPGVTSALLRRLADAAGVRTHAQEVPVRELDGLEVWAVNALHGIRPVTGWVGAPMRPGPPRHAARWRARLATDRVVV